VCVRGLWGGSRMADDMDRMDEKRLAKKFAHNFRSTFRLYFLQTNAIGFSVFKTGMKSTLISSAPIPARHVGLTGSGPGGGRSRPPQTKIFSHQCGGHLQPVGGLNPPNPPDKSNAAWIACTFTEETNCNCCTAAYLFTYCCLLFLLSA